MGKGTRGSEEERRRERSWREGVGATGGSGGCQNKEEREKRAILSHPYYLSCCLIAVNQPCDQPGSQARRRRGTPGVSTDSPGVTGCQGAASHTGAGTLMHPSSGYVLGGGSETVTNVPCLYNRAHRTDSYDDEVGSSLTCTLTTYEFGSFSNAPMSLIVTYC